MKSWYWGLWYYIHVNKLLALWCTAYTGTNQNNSLMFSWQRKLTIGAFTLLTSRFLNSRFFVSPFTLAQKTPNLAQTCTKLHDFLDRYCACPTISYFSFDRECLQLCVCVCVCVCACVCLCLSCVCVCHVCVCLPLCVFAHVCVSNTNVLV